MNVRTVVDRATIRHPRLVRLLWVAVALAWYGGLRWTLALEDERGQRAAIDLASTLLDDRIAQAKLRTQNACELLADDPRLKVVLGAEIDPLSAQESLDDIRELLGLEIAAALSPSGQVTAEAGAGLLAGLDLSRSELIAQLGREDRAVSAVWGLHHRLLIVSAKALRLGPRHVATILLGAPIADQDLANIAALTGTAGVLWIGDRVVAQTPGVHPSELPLARSLEPGQAVTLRAEGDPRRALAQVVGESILPARVVWLRSLGGAGGGARWPISLLGLLPVGAVVLLAAAGRSHGRSQAAAAVLASLAVTALPAPSWAQVGSATVADWAPPPAEPAPTALAFGLVIDAGAFIPTGSGAGVTEDIGNRAVPELAGRFGWVFLGDLLSTAVNSRGEVADLGELPGIRRFDPIHARGAFGFILNQVSVSATGRIGRQLLASAILDFLPRTGRDFALGDSFAVDRAYLEWLALEGGALRIQAGKIESVIGTEYRRRRPELRFGITPSLVARYTTGTPLGIAARSALFDQRILLAVSLANGSSGIEPFHFYDETDSNSGKTASGRFGVRVPLEGLGAAFASTEIEAGVSGLVGPQDVARDSEDLIWLIGADLALRGVTWALRAELMRSRAPGRASDGAYALQLDAGGYVEAEWLFHPLLGASGRIELRDALVSLGTERAYLSKVWRLTAGLRVVPTSELAIKLEYLHNGELDPLTPIDNDIFTTSMVVQL